MSGKCDRAAKKNNTGNSDNFEETVHATKAAAVGNSLGPLVSEALKIPLLVPVFPRTAAEALVYTHTLDRDTVLIEKGLLARLDKQLISMVDDARSKLAGRNIDVAPRFLMVGKIRISMMIKSAAQRALSQQ